MISILVTAGQLVHTKRSKQTNVLWAVCYTKGEAQLVEGRPPCVNTRCRLRRRRINESQNRITNFNFSGNDCNDHYGDDDGLARTVQLWLVYKQGRQL